MRGLATAAMALWGASWAGAHTMHLYLSASDDLSQVPAEYVTGTNVVAAAGDPLYLWARLDPPGPWISVSLVFDGPVAGGGVMYNPFVEGVQRWQSASDFNPADDNEVLLIAVTTAGVGAPGDPLRIGQHYLLGEVVFDEEGDLFLEIGEGGIFCDACFPQDAFVFAGFTPDGEADGPLPGLEAGGKTAFSDAFIVGDPGGEPPVAQFTSGGGFDLDADGFATVTLDGSASFDPDGVIVEYVWRADDDVLAAGPAPVVEVVLPVGATEVELTVIDDDEQTGEAERVVAVFGPGDLNCDLEITGFDIDPFALALSDPAGYAVAFPDCNGMLADVNGDGVVNGFDIDAFVDALTGEASFMSRAGVRAAVLDALE